jgi:hypothetical protein
MRCALADDLNRGIGDIDPVLVECIVLTGAGCQEFAEAVRELEHERVPGEMHHVGSSTRVDDFDVLDAEVDETAE